MENILWFTPLEVRNFSFCRYESIGLLTGFKQIGIHDVPRVGGKNASLREMSNNLAPKRIIKERSNL